MITDEEYTEYNLEIEAIEKPHGNMAQAMLSGAYNSLRMKDLAKTLPKRRGALACMREAVKYAASKFPGAVLVWDEEFFRASALADLVGV